MFVNFIPVHCNPSLHAKDPAVVSWSHSFSSSSSCHCAHSTHLRREKFPKISTRQSTLASPCTQRASFFSHLLQFTLAHRPITKYSRRVCVCASISARRLCWRVCSRRKSTWCYFNLTRTCDRVIMADVVAHRREVALESPEADVIWWVACGCERWEIVVTFFPVWEKIKY